MAKKAIAPAAVISLICLIVSAAYGRDQIQGGMAKSPSLDSLVPGQSTKAQVQSMLGTPWRVVQFDDCGDAMAGQADETWEYRGKDANGGYRVHVEFDDQGVVELAAKVPDQAGEEQGVAAKISNENSDMASMPM